jgi:cobalt-zinc-cadmium efflux system membrane fusion protein
MASRWRGFLWFVLGHAPTLLVLIALGGLAVWGKANHWKIGKEEPKKEEAEKKERAAHDPIPLSSEAAEKAGIKVAAARRQTVREYVRAPGTLAFDPDRFAQLSTRAPGPAWRVDRRVGDSVEKGDILFVVSSAELGKLKADLLQDLVQVEVRDKALKRLESVPASVPAGKLLDARAALREARIRLLADQQALANLGLSLRLDDLRDMTDNEVARHLRLLGLPANIAPPAEVDRLPANLLPLRAPFAGVVVKRNVVVGEVVTPDRPQFVLADPSRLWLMLDVRLEDVSQLKIGQEVTFHADSTGQKATGKLSWIAAEVDPKTRTVRARAELDNPGAKLNGSSGTASPLRPATFGMGKVEVRSTKAVVVPDGAVQWDGKAHCVFVRVDEKTYYPRLVRPGTTADGVTPLLPDSNVRAGEKVVTAGSHVLKSEMLKGRIGGED